jgi:hypothetical protein
MSPTTALRPRHSENLDWTRARLVGWLLAMILTGCARAESPARTISITTPTAPAGATSAAPLAHGAPPRPGQTIWATRLGFVPVPSLQIAAGTRGEVFATGTFSNAVLWGRQRVSSAGGSDVLLAQLDPGGAPGWVRRFGGAEQDSGVALAVSAGGDLALVGDFEGTIDFGGGPLRSVGSDAFVASFDHDGALRWAKSLSGKEGCYASAVAVDEARNVFVLGMFKGTVDLRDGVSLHAPPDTGGIFLAMLDPRGKTLWARGFDADSPANHHHLAVGPGGAVLCGTFSGALRSGGRLLAQTADDDEDAFVVAFDAAGNMVWERVLASPNRDDCESIAVDPQGNVLVAGGFDDDRGGLFVPKSGAIFTPSKLSPPWRDPANGRLAAKGRRVLIKLDPHGKTLWQKHAWTDGVAYGDAVAVDRAGNIVLAGRFDGRSLDVGLGAMRGAGDSDIFVVKLRPDGAPRWATTFGGPGEELLGSLVVDASGAPILAGMFEATVDFGVVRLRSDDEHITFVAKLAP